MITTIVRKYWSIDMKLYAENRCVSCLQTLAIWIKSETYFGIIYQNSISTVQYLQLMTPNLNSIQLIAKNNQLSMHFLPQKSGSEQQLLNTYTVKEHLFA